MAIAYPVTKQTNESTVLFNESSHLELIHLG